ncbi:MAG TPA: acyltransferase family protein [Candidatus Baltobacteraceae bacterium]|nr:acyltransferase family protein [Candidatus Baltobacteraceae bacterium]
MLSHDLHDGGILVREEIPSSDVVRERFGYLDGLRTLAIVAVLFAEASKHANLLGYGHPALQAALRACGHGLDLFFVISGFALAYPILTLVHQDGRTYLDVARYALKRLIRIVPTYWVAIALTVLVPYLAGRFALGALEGPVPSASEILRAAFFIGNPLPNDGFWSLALTMRWYVVFPLLVLLWVRSPIAFLLTGAAAWLLQLFTPAHALNIGVLPAFMLGIVAADVRAQSHRLERFALPLALIVAAGAVFLEPILGSLPTAQSPGPSFFVVNPLWQIALFLLVAGIGYLGPLERVFGLRLFGPMAAASYAISLVADPVVAFVMRQLTPQLGAEGAAINAGALAVIMGVIFWQLVDRWFYDSSLRPRLVDALAPLLRVLLTSLHASRIDYAGRRRLRAVTAFANEAAPEAAGFYAPPPRGSGDLAVVMQRTGSPEQLAAEILETKKRLAEQSAALFADPVEEPKPIPVEPERAPGFYEHGQRAAAAPLDAVASIDDDPFVTQHRYDVVPVRASLPPAPSQPAAPIPAPYVAASVAANDGVRARATPASDAWSAPKPYELERAAAPTPAAAQIPSAPQAGWSDPAPPQAGWSTPPQQAAPPQAGWSDPAPPQAGWSSPPPQAAPPPQAGWSDPTPPQAGWSSPPPQAAWSDPVPPSRPAEPVPQPPAWSQPPLLAPPANGEPDPPRPPPSPPVAEPMPPSSPVAEPEPSAPPAPSEWSRREFAVAQDDAQPASQEAPAQPGRPLPRSGEGRESTAAPADPASARPGLRVSLTLRPARPPIKVRIGPSAISAPPSVAPTNGKYALDDVIDG